jgi:hypothetical protein
MRPERVQRVSRMETKLTPTTTHLNGWGLDDEIYCPAKRSELYRSHIGTRK